MHVYPKQHGSLSEVHMLPKLFQQYTWGCVISDAEMQAEIR